MQGSLDSRSPRFARFALARDDRMIGCDNAALKRCCTPTGGFLWPGLGNLRRAFPRRRSQVVFGEPVAQKLKAFIGRIDDAEQVNILGRDGADRKSTRLNSS